MTFRLLFLLAVLAQVCKAQLAPGAAIDHLVPDGVDSTGGISLHVTGGTGPYTYSWTPGGATTSSITGVPKGAYTVKIKSSGGDSLIKTFNIGYKAQWADLYKCYVRNDSLLQNAWDWSTAITRNSLAPNTSGWVETVINSSYTERYFGLADSLSPLKDDNGKDVDYGFRIDHGTGVIYTVIGGYEISGVKYLAWGDVLRAERSGDTMKLRINGSIVYSSPVTGISQKPLKVIARLYRGNGFDNVGCSFSKKDSTYYPGYLQVFPYITHNSGPGVQDGSIKPGALTGSVYTYSWTGGVTTTTIGGQAANYAVTVSDSTGNQSRYSYDLAYKTKWTGISNCTLGHDTLAGSLSYGVWGSANSKNVLDSLQDGWVQYVNTQLYTIRAFGFADSIYSPYYYDIDAGFYFDGPSNYIYAYIGGSFVAMIYSESAIGDVYRLERAGNVVNFRINGIIRYSITMTNSTHKRWMIKGSTYHGQFVNLGCNFSTPFRLAIAKQQASYEDLRSGMIDAEPYNGRAPYTVSFNDADTGKVRFGLAPGDYLVSATDSTGDVTGAVVSIGVKPNWRVQDTSIHVNADTFSVASGRPAAHLVTYNTLLPTENGWTEITLGAKNQHFAFGFIGATSGENDAAYATPYISDAKLAQKLAFADSLSGGLFSGTTYTANAQYAKVHLVSFYNGTATALFKGASPTTVSYDAGDVFKLRRTKGVLTLERNGTVVSTSTVTASDAQNVVTVFSIKGGDHAAIVAPGSYNNAHNDFGHTAMPFAGCADNDFNWTYSRSFDETGLVKDEAKQYMDALGRTIQSQSRLFSKNNTLVSEPLYDAFGRAVGQTLPAPSYTNTLCYVNGFITNSSEDPYTYTDFDKPLGTYAAGEIYNPNTVGNSTQGTLGWYYSNNNTAEPLVAASSYPYNRVQFYDDPLGRPMRVAGVGEQHRMGANHETRYIYTSVVPGNATNELYNVFPYKTYELLPDFTAPGYSINGQNNTDVNNNLTLFKTVMLNADGRDQVSYTNSAGQVIATCVAGDEGGCGQDQVLTDVLGNTSNYSHVQVYIPKGKTGTLKIHDLVGSTSITPVIKDIMTGSTLSSGTDYNYTSGTGEVAFAGSYADAGATGASNHSLYLDISYSSSGPATGHQFVVEHKVNYTQWSLYFYDRKGRLLANVSPNDVVCQPQPSAHKSTGHGPVSTCDAGNPDLMTVSFARGGLPATINDVGILVIKPEATPIDSAFVTHLASDFIYKSANAQRYDDSVFFSGVDTLTLDSICLAAIDTSYTNHIYRLPDSLMTELLPGSLPPQSGLLTLRYTGDYRIYMDSSTTPLPQVIPFDFTFTFDSTGTPSVDAGPLPVLGRIGPVPLYGYNRFRLRAENLSVFAPGFYYGSHGACDGTLPADPYTQSLFDNVAHHIGVQANLTIMSYGTPNTPSFFTTYTYDEYDRLIASNTQDEGRVDYLYDQAEDKLFFTQNDKQRANGGKFSALLYDKLGRVVQTGEYDPLHGGPTSGGEVLQFQTYDDYFKNAVAPATGYVSVGDYAAANVSPFTWGHLFETNSLVYDTLDKALPNEISGYAQHYLAGRVSKSFNDHDTTWYSYDDLGRQAWSVQYLDGLNAYKMLDYDYDMRGKLTHSYYQKGTSADKLVHLYSYDADERLSAASIMRGASPTQYPVAAYEYYIHGPLKRAVLGNNLQGLDYVYTIGGQLKGVNNPMATSASDDPGQDSYVSGSHASVKADVFGYALDYYNDDYVRSGSPIKPYNSSNYFGNVSYAGLVKATRWKTTLPTGVTDDYSGAARMYEYDYNDLYQLAGASFSTTALSSGNVTFTGGNDYKLESMAYDANGNLQSLKRYKKAVSGTASLLDDLAYSYHGTKTNRLLQVDDAASTSGIALDMDFKDQSTGNYGYNAIGEMTLSVQEDRGYEYNASGLCTRAYQSSTGYNLATYEYNDKGQRHSKTSYDNTGTAIKTTWYVYDAGGMQVATYEKDLTISGSPVLKDLEVYAAGRLGVYDDAAAKVFYELNDHLGNTRALVTETSGAAEVLSFTDYYPHGGVMPGQNYIGASAYRYGYQGQEKDVETGLVNFELRQYDPRLGRWYNPDPMGQHHSPYLAMGNNPVVMSDPNGGRDFEWWGGEGNNEGEMPTAARKAQDNWNGISMSEWSQDHPGNYSSSMNVGIGGELHSAEDVAMITTMTSAFGSYQSAGTHYEFNNTKNEFGYWKKMNFTSGNPRMYKAGTTEGEINGGITRGEPTASEWWYRIGQSGRVRKMLWAANEYGGTGDGSFLDQLHLAFHNTNKYNPITHLVNGIDGLIFGTDRFGHAQTGLQTTTNLASGITFMFGGAISDAIVGVTVAEGVPVATIPQIQLNKAAGDAFRDELAEALKQEGRQVAKEVYKPTPFGPRYMDIEVSLDGKVLGGIETKTGNSPYNALQRLKDIWLDANTSGGYPVNVVRKPSDW